MKGIHGQPPNSIILYGKILKAFPLRSRTRQSCLLLSLLFKNCTGGSDQGNKARKEMKGIEFRKEGIQLSLFSDDLILYWKKTILKMKKKVGKLTVPDLKTYCMQTYINQDSVLLA